MRLSEVEEHLGAIGDAGGSEFLFELLAAYGTPKAAIARLRSGTYDKGNGEGEHLWKGKVWFRSADLPAEQLYPLIDAARADERVQRERPRFLIATNDERVLAIDTKTGGTLDILRSELVSNADFFMPWAGFEKTQLENVNVADIKAAEKMARLYDEITRHNSIETEEEAHELNVFFSRLLFCFFAEDTGVFDRGIFTNAIGSLTREDGDDMPAFFDRLFELLDTRVEHRGDVPVALRNLGYVNGNLFRQRHDAPRFSAKARSVILDCGTLDWSQINPDIFGSMMQAVVTPSQREGLGMHYTSVENILKVIRPLFLDELEEALVAADTVRKLENLRKRIAGIQVFDPACGSGNFLVIAYKELRRLEHEILQRIRELEPHRATLFAQSDIDLANFYGIEIDDFAHEIAILSLWLAKHQMNAEFKELFGAEIPLIPLVEAGQITCGNAARLDWESVCPTNEGIETFVCGNPPYQGARVQSPEQKKDFDDIPAIAQGRGNLDYVAIWLMKAADYVAGGAASAGLVATSSVCQGAQVSLLWPAIYAAGVDISFAVQSFRWSNRARANAGVACVIVGLSSDPPPKKWLYADSTRHQVPAITPYLTAGSGHTIVAGARTQLFGLPPLTFGSMPNDGGALILTAGERDRLLSEYPSAERYVKRFLGSSEFIGGSERYALWIADVDVDEAQTIPLIAERLRRVAASRAASKRAVTRALARSPHRFGEIRHQDGTAIAVPAVTSERREYIPLDFVDGSTVVSNKIFAVYNADPWLFALLHSRMHMAWVRAVAGRLESRYNYASTVVYNTFPVPDLTEAHRSTLEQTAFRILAAREQFSDRTLGELYDPDKMPGGLREAHRAADETVDRIYSAKGFASDDERLQLLFDMYEKAIAKEKAG